LTIRRQWNRLRENIVWSAAGVHGREPASLVISRGATLAEMIFHKVRRSSPRVERAALREGLE